MCVQPREFLAALSAYVKFCSIFAMLVVYGVARRREKGFCACANTFAKDIAVAWNLRRVLNSMKLVLTERGTDYERS